MAGTREFIRDAQQDYEADIRTAADSTLRGNAPVFVPYDTFSSQQIYEDYDSNPYAYPQGYVDPAATVAQPAFMYDRADLQWSDYLRTSDAEDQLEETEQHSDSLAYGHPLVWIYEHPPFRHDEFAQSDTAAFGLWEREGALNRSEQYRGSKGQADGVGQGAGTDWSPTLLYDDADWNTSAADLGPDASLVQDQAADGRSGELQDESFLDPLLRSTSRRVVSTALTSAAGDETKEGAGDFTSGTLLPVQRKETAFTGSPRNYEKSIVDPELRIMPTAASASTNTLSQIQSVGYADAAASASQHEDRADGDASTQSLQTSTNSGVQPSMSAGGPNTLRINTQIPFTKQQKFQIAKEKMALRPIQPMPRTLTASIHWLDVRRPLFATKVV